MIIANSFEFAHSHTHRQYFAKIQHRKFPKQLTYTAASDDLPEVLDPRADWLAVALLYPAMLLGEDLQIDHPVSEELLFSLNGDVQSLLHSYDPQLKPVQIIAPSAPTRVVTHAPDVATGYSAGVDSFATLALYGAPETPSSQHISRLTLFNVGAMGHRPKSGPLFQQYSDRVRDFAKLTGRSWLTVDSNLSDFFKAIATSFQKSHTLRNASAALMFEDMLSLYHYSSSYDFKNINVGYGDMSHLDPILLPLLSTQNLRFLSSGAGLNRIEKTRLVSQMTHARVALDVCIKPAKERVGQPFPNCSECTKCRRTIGTLIALDRVLDFDSVFDLATYKADPAGYTAELGHGLKDGNQLDQEARRLLITCGKLAEDTPDQKSKSKRWKFWGS